MSDDFKEDLAIEGDREFPSVKQNNDYTKIWAGLFLIFGVLAIIFVIYDGMKDSAPRKMTDAQEDTFQTYSGNSGPFINDPIEAPSEITLNESQPVVESYQGPTQQELMMQQEAMRIAREKLAEEKRRIASPQLIFDEKSPSAVNAQGTTTTGSSLGGVSDPNLAFAAQYGNASVETARATQLQNLDALITQGTMIDGILETAVQSDLPGMVRAIVSENVYSFEGANLLIPKGSKLIGRYNSGLVRGQSRVFVIWNRVIRPDGASIIIGSYGADSLGRSGLAGEVDTHFFERFGSSILLSMINAGIEIGVNSLDDQDAATVAVDSGSDFSRSAEIALENSIGIKPTVNIHQGTQIKVFVGKDLDFNEVSASAN